MVKYSVIVPVYNAEKTLRRCVDSLLSQKRDDVEIILVNDGSGDGSLGICNEYRQRFSCVCVIDKENGGVSSARNAGLEAAGGQYILFVDSDDYVATDLLQKVDVLLSKDAWDLIRFSTCPAEAKALEECAARQTEYRTRDDCFLRLIDDICSKALNGPVAKVYSSEILKREQIRFPLGVSVAEDRAFNIHYSMFVERYLISDYIVYYVNTDNEQSLSRKRHEDLPEQFRIADCYTDDAIRQADIPDREKELYHRAVNFGKCRSIYKYAKDLRRDKIGWFQRQRALWKRCAEINHQKMRYPATRYCRLITFPVWLWQTWIIDFIAKRLLR